MLPAGGIVSRLPVSGAQVVVRMPDGADDILLLEAPQLDVRLALILAARLSQASDGSALAWETRPVSDLDVLLLLLRKAVLGDLIRADVLCPAQGCGARIDIAFRIGDYLDHHRPRRPRGVEPAAEVGWFRLRDAPVIFRPPTAGDLAAVVGHRYPERALIARCILPVDLPARLRRRVETAMEAMAPSLSGELEGQCPDCGARVPVYFDPLQFCLGELRAHAVFLYEDIHLIARAYHWSETEILALPRSRRLQYAEMVRQDQRTG